jgi:hypothetical protein
MDNDWSLLPDAAPDTLYAARARESWFLVAIMF